MKRRIAIIGGGAASACMLNSLIARASAASRLHIQWYTGRGIAPRGVAYTTNNPRHLLNVRASRMSLSENHPSGFLEYAQQRDPTVTGDAFLPRGLYGDYLENEVTRILREAVRLHVEVEVIPGEVTRIEPRQQHHIDVWHEDHRREAHAAVLAIGALSARPLSVVSPAALRSGRYISDPWAMLTDRSHDEAPRRVLIIGLGLTTADLLLELAARWPDTHFTALSRHGCWPETQSAQSSPHYPAADALAQLLLTVPNIRSRMRLLREAMHDHIDPRAVVDGLRPYVTSLWCTLSQIKRSRFMRHARWIWERERHRMPEATAAALAVLQQSGRLTLRKGRVTDVQAMPDALTLCLHQQPGQTTLRLKAELIIQATGLNTHIAGSQHALLLNLLQSGHALADPLGLGFIASIDGRLWHNGGGAWSHLFTMGSMLRGACWECTAIPEIRQHAEQVAERMLSQGF